MNHYITCIQFNKNSLRILTGYYFKNNVYVLNALEEEVMIKPDISTRDCYIEALKKALEKQKQQLNGDFFGVFVVLLPYESLMIEQRVSKTTTIDPDSLISQVDYDNCLSIISKELKIENHTLIYSDPYQFFDENKNSYLKFPLGIRSDSLCVYADNFLIDTETYQFFKKVLDSLYINPYLTLPNVFSSVAFARFLKAPIDHIALFLDDDSTNISLISNNRLSKNKIINVTIREIITKASENYGLSYENAKHLFELSSLKREIPFDYSYKEVSILKANNFFKKGFKDMLEKIKDFLLENKVPPNIPLILYSKANDIQDFDFYLKSLSREIIKTSLNVIGANESAYFPLLGSLSISNLSYQKNYNDIYRKQESLFLRIEKINRNE